MLLACMLCTVGNLPFVGSIQWLSPKLLKWSPSMPLLYFFLRKFGYFWTLLGTVLNNFLRELFHVFLYFHVFLTAFFAMMMSSSVCTHRTLGCPFGYECPSVVANIVFIVFITDSEAAEDHFLFSTYKMCWFNLIKKCIYLDKAEKLNNRMFQISEIKKSIW